MSRDLPGDQVGVKVECDEHIKPMAEMACHAYCNVGIPDDPESELSNLIPTSSMKNEWRIGPWGQVILLFSA